MKVCSNCKLRLETIEFSKHSSRKDGLQMTCKACGKVQSKAWREANQDKSAANNKSWRDANSDYDKDYREANPYKVTASRKAWREANRAKDNAIGAKRRASKLKATPSWLTKEDYLQIESLYDQAQQLTLAKGVKHHVDHIYPLQGKTVCGLHVPSNLQVLTATENCSKSNNFTDWN